MFRLLMFGLLGFSAARLLKTKTRVLIIDRTRNEDGTVSVKFNTLPSMEEALQAAMAGTLVTKPLKSFLTDNIKLDKTSIEVADSNTEYAESK